jgi:RNA polymerase sigma factor (sigma-70 family)
MIPFRRIGPRRNQVGGKRNDAVGCEILQIPVPMQPEHREAVRRPEGGGSPGNRAMAWDETTLCAAIGAGDARAEAELCLRFRDRIRHKVERSVRRAPDCEDLTVEILQAILTSLRRGSFRGECALGTFVHAVAKNKVAEFLRRKRPESLELTEALGLCDEAPAPDDVAAREETACAVRAALEDLGPRHRQVLCLYFYRGLSVAQIAERLGLSPRQISECKDYALRVLRTRCGTALRRYL